MSDHVDAALAELKTIIRETWPEVVDEDDNARIYEHNHITTIPFEDLELPFVSIISEGSPWDEAPINGQHRYTMLDLQIYYCGRAPATAAPIRTKVQALREALQNAAPVNFQRFPPAPFPQWGGNLDINRLLRAKKLPHQAGRLECRLLSGDDV